MAGPEKAVLDAEGGKLSKNLEKKTDFASWCVALQL